MTQILHSKIIEGPQDKTPLLVLHGLFGMLDNWGSFGREMSTYFPVHLLDLRNHGRSFHSDSMSHADLAEDIFSYLQHYQIPKASLLGHSLGGKAVMTFAIEHPDMVEKLIVADIAPKAYPPHHQGIIKALQSVDFEKQTSRQQVEAVLAQYIPDKAQIQFLAKNLYWTPEKKLAWRFNLKTLAEKYNDFVSNAIPFGVFRGPVLFVGGDRSNYILPQDEFSIRQQFPAAEFATVSNSGHWVHADNPAEFLAIVKKFLVE